MVINITNLKNKALGLGCEVKENVSMKDYTTFKTGGNCQLLISPNSAGALSEIIKECNKTDTPYTVLGNGSNVLVSDDGLEGVVIHIADGLNKIKLSDETTIYCEAGVKLGTLCNFALENSLTGLEFAFGIPGSVGGAIFMNAGAYGGEMKDVVTKVYHIDKDGNEGCLIRDNLAFGYRTSAYESNGFIITGVEIELQKGENSEIKEKMNDLLGRRKDKQPLEYPSAGSTFKRPEGYFAGALIEECGLKGKQIGGARVSEKHAGFVINYDNATTSDILSLMDFIVDTVKREKGVTLTPEVRILR
ncbi:MAG: UDP-N-acetylmuramate dehydrogenase [Ruminococcaceae bacterium]|nr:UDP-N-acetylmuramate dehydrogenase [Oscillospiraceae bacterium]